MRERISSERELEAFWKEGAPVILITRPRRFGKSLALSMFRYFFEKTTKSTSHLFEKSKIWKEEKFRKIQGTYPVIYISFKDIKAQTWDLAYQELKEVLAREVRRTLKPLEHLMKLNLEVPFFLLQRCLKSVFQKIPLYSLMSMTLRLPMLDCGFSDKFGFTEEEVSNLLSVSNRPGQEKEVKEWYNGYIVGTKNSKLAQAIYSPWSVLNYLESLSEHPQRYWVNTGSTDLLECLIAEADVKIQEELKVLIEGKALENKSIDEDVILLDLDKKRCEPWSFLFFAGYLTATSYTFEGKYQYRLELPNREISDLYKDLVIKSISKKLLSAELVDFLKALITGNVSRVETLLGEFIQSFCSSHDLSKNDLERSLHLFVLGLLASLSERYIINSNIESGKGRYDIMLCPRSHSQDPGILLKFKKGDNLEKLEEEALEQIKAQNYKAKLHKLGFSDSILCYGIASCKKEILVKLKMTH